MKTLVNKNNPAIRITAPEFKMNEYGRWYTPDETRKTVELTPENWTLIEEKPVEWSEEDEAMRDNILRLLSCFVGTTECDSNPSLSISYPVYQREIDWLKSLRPQSKDKQKPVDLEKELQAFLCNYDYEFDDDDPVPFDIARHFYELGLNARM